MNNILSDVAQSVNTPNKLVSALVKLAQTIKTEWQYDKFVPCFVVPGEGNKRPCKGATNYTEGFSADTIGSFRIECLGLLLGDRYIAIDIDAEASFEKLEQVRETLGLSELPETYRMSSNPGVREGRIYKIPEGYTIAHKSLYGNELEVRTGDHYQIIAGKHPKGAYTVLNACEPAILPEDWASALQDGTAYTVLPAYEKENPSNLEKTDDHSYSLTPPGKGMTLQEKLGRTATSANGKGVSEVKESKGNKKNKGKENDKELLDLEVALSVITRYAPDYLDAKNHDTRVKIGMMINTIDQGQDGFDVWERWMNSCDYSLDERGSTGNRRKEHNDKWKSFKPHKPGGVTKYSIVYSSHKPLLMLRT
jgi:Primase C terminal 2 (PriCT-2)